MEGNAWTSASYQQYLLSGGSLDPATGDPLVTQVFLKKLM